MNVTVLCILDLWRIIHNEIITTLFSFNPSSILTKSEKGVKLLSFMQKQYKYNQLNKQKSKERDGWFTNDAWPLELL